MTAWNRRDFLRFGCVQLAGFGLPVLAAASRPRARACILLFTDGGNSHIDTFDMKPDAPAEIRGPFGSIPTTVPGIRVCEHLPHVARQMHRLVQVRSVRHEETVHDPAVYQTLTGYRHPSSGGDLKVDPNDFPQIGAAFAAVQPSPTAMPTAVELPETMKMGARVLPGQSAGFLGPSRDPFRVSVTPAAKVVPPELGLPPQVDDARHDRRSGLLQRLNRRLALLADREELSVLDDYQRQALGILSDSRVQRAFELEREPVSLRECYGRYRHGQSVLLARRLVEAGARFVTVYWGREPQDWADGQGPRPTNNPWDTHRNHFPLVKDELLPRADRTLAALVQDLADRGLLEETLVVWMGEFGRTPRISEFASRDHWPNANTLLLAGAGLPGGAVFGRTDATAAEVTENPVSPADITATIYHLLGVDPGTLIRTPQGRPHPLSEGRPIRQLAG